MKTIVTAALFAALTVPFTYAAQTPDNSQTTTQQEHKAKKEKKQKKHKKDKKNGQTAAPAPTN